MASCIYCAIVIIRKDYDLVETKKFKEDTEDATFKFILDHKLSRIFRVSRFGGTWNGGMEYWNGGMVE